MRQLAAFTAAIISVTALAREPELPVPLITGLNLPTSVAIQPETEVVFVAESGQGRVLRLIDGLLQPVITDFPVVPLLDYPGVKLGPVGLLFLSKEILLVSCRLSADDTPLIRVYRVPEDSSSIRYEAALSQHSLGPLEDRLDLPAHSMAMTATAERVYYTVMSDTKTGRIIHSDRSGDDISELRSWIDREQSSQQWRPSGISISPHGYLVVSTVGDWGEQSDSRLAFFELSSKRKALELETGLNDVIAVLYSNRKQLYLLDMALSNPSSGGLYRSLADPANPSGMIVKPIAALDHPTSMIFDSQGTLLITTWGRMGTEQPPQGALWQLSRDAGL
jgi:hypothetical protein